MLTAPYGLRPTSKLFVHVIFIFTYPSGWPKYCKTLRNIFILARFNKNVLQLNAKKHIGLCTYNYIKKASYSFRNLFQSLRNLKARQPSMRQKSNVVFAASRTPFNLTERRQEKYYSSKQVSIFVTTTVFALC